MNIIGVLNQLQLAPDTLNQLRPVIDDYEIRLDEALRYREQVVDNAQPKVKDAMINMDFDAGMSAMDTIMAARIQVRNIQDSSAAAIAAAMTPEVAAEFMTRYYESAYSKVFRPSPMERTFEVARGLEDLTADQMAEIVELETGYNADYATSSMQILAVLREEEPKDARRKAEAIRARQSGAAPAKRESEPLSERVRDPREPDRAGDGAVAADPDRRTVREAPQQLARAARPPRTTTPNGSMPPDADPIRRPAAWAAPARATRGATANAGRRTTSAARRRPRTRAATSRLPASAETEAAATSNVAAVPRSDRRTERGRPSGEAASHEIRQEAAFPMTADDGTFSSASARPPTAA